MGPRGAYERFIWFDHKVRSKTFPNATTISDRFELSVKTAQRDIEFMRDRLNCPLVYDNSRKGYCYEDETFSLPMVHLSSAELSSLLIARKMLQGLRGESINNELSHVVDKITGILNSHISEAGIIDDAFSLQLRENAPVPEDVFKLVLEGCLKRRSLSISYASPLNTGKMTRTIDPYHLFNYMGTWHLIAYCHERRDLRDFNLLRMTGARLLDSEFVVRRDFSIPAYFGSAFGLFKGERTTQVTLRFSPLKSGWLKGQIWHKAQKEKVMKDGSLEVTFPVASYVEIMMEILRHGSGVEVVKPRELRELIKAEALKIAGIYR